jgi:transcription elongation GreA/GreB family factor
MTEASESSDLIQVNLPTPDYQYGEVLKQIEKDIPKAISQAHAILDPIDINDDSLAELDEEPIIQATRDLRNVKAYGKKYDQMIKIIKRRYNDARDQEVINFQKRFDQMGVNELLTLIDKGDDVNRRLKEQRKTQRWNQLQAKFEQTLKLYPLLDEFIPRRTKFTQFKEAHPKLVSAARNSDVTQTMFDAVTAYVGNMQEDVQTILDLQSIFQEELFKQYQEFPEIHRIISLNNDLIRKREQEEKIAQQKRDAEIKRQAEEMAKKLAAEQEAKRIAAEQKAIKEAQAEVKKNGDKAKVIIKTVSSPSANPNLKVSKESRANAGSPFAETLESYLKKTYPDVSTDALRFDAIFSIMKDIGNQKPEIMRFIKSPTHGLDAIKLLIERPAK